MSTTTEIDNSSALGTSSRTQGKLTFAHVLRFEWIKLRSLRSTWLTLVAIFVVIAVFGVLGAAMSSSDAEVNGGGDGFGPSSPVDIVLTGANLALLIVGVLGAVVGAREYSSGMVRLTFAAVPRRVNVLWAKLLVFAGLVLATVVVPLLIAFFAGMEVLSAAGQETVSWSDPGVARAVLGTGAYLVGVGIGGVVLGVLLRSVAGGIGVLIGGVLFVPTLAGALLPDSWDAALKYLPSNAGAAFTSLSPPAGMLDATAGAVVLLLWVAAGVAGAAIALRRRDV